VVTAVVWVLCRLLPEGFRARQRAEWTGDLIALSASGAAVRWRYLLAAAWTLPSLRAHARRAGLDRPHEIVPASVPVRTLARVIIVALGAPVVAWLIAVPSRWYLLDVPSRLASSFAFDPKDLWPTSGVLGWLSPLWIALHLGAWTMVFSTFLVTWTGATAMVMGPLQRGATGRQRFYTALLGLGIMVVGNAILTGLALANSARGALFPLDKGFAAGVIGAAGVVTGLLAPGLSRRSRITVLTVSLTAIAIFAFQFTELGSAMFTWLLD
jgi:hypothetical protein